MKFFLFIFAITAQAFAQKVAIPNGATLGDAEAQKIEEKISSVRRDLLSKYRPSLPNCKSSSRKSRISKVRSQCAMKEPAPILSNRWQNQIWPRI